MNKWVKLIIFFGLVFSGLMLVLAQNTKFESAARRVITETQNKLYVSNCARCHGADGKGNTQLGQEMGVPDLTTSRISNTKIKQMISKGDGDMPAFSKKLKAAQINTLVNTIRSLRQ